MSMHRLSHRFENEWREHNFDALFNQEECGPSARLVAGIPHGDSRIFEQMVCSLEPPYYLLYVLHTSRGEGEIGRYQAGEVSQARLREFLNRFSTFFAADARFDLWAHSPADNATIVWDRHNLLYAYGPLERISTQLSELGYTDGNPVIPGPHLHHYREEMDIQATEILSAFEWTWSPLRAEDEQWTDTPG